MIEYAVVVDESYHAVLLRDLCQQEAQKYHDRWANATTRHAVNRNLQRYEIFAQYAERFDSIRLREIEKIMRTVT